METRLEDKVLSGEDDVTETVLSDFEFSKGTEKDIENVEGEIEDDSPGYEEMEEFIKDRLSMISSWNSRASSTSIELVEGDDTFDDAMQIIQIPSGEDRYVLNHSESASVNKVLTNAQELIGQLTVMLKLAVDTLEYAEDAVDIQRQQKVQKEVLQIMKDNVGDVMRATAENSVKDVTKEAVEEAATNEDLQGRISELENQIDALNEDIAGLNQTKLANMAAEELEEELSVDELTSNVDLKTVFRNSTISTKTEIAKILKAETELTNEHIAGIIDSSAASVGNMTSS